MIAVRQRFFFEDSERHWTLVGSIVERGWVDEVKSRSGAVHAGVRGCADGRC